MNGPDEGRFQGALFFGASRLKGREYVAATSDFLRAAAFAEPAERELARGLVHLAAAGYRRRIGDERGYARQLAHARRRLAPFLPAARHLDLAGLLAGVEERRT